MRPWPLENRLSLAQHIAGLYGVPVEAVSSHQPFPRVTDEEQNA